MHWFDQDWSLSTLFGDNEQQQQHQQQQPRRARRQRRVLQEQEPMELAFAPIRSTNGGHTPFARVLLRCNACANRPEFVGGRALWQHSQDAAHHAPGEVPCPLCPDDKFRLTTSVETYRTHLRSHHFLASTVEAILRIGFDSD